MRQFGKRERASKGAKGGRTDVALYLLATGRRGGDDARRRATLDIAATVDKNGLVEGSKAILAPPRRASAEECMSRTGDWKEPKVTTTKGASVKGASKRRRRGAFCGDREARREKEREREREKERASFSLLFSRRPIHLFFFLCSGSLALQQQRATAAAGRSPFSSLEATHA